MSGHLMNRYARDIAIEQSLDAAMEVNEVISGVRTDAPALGELIGTLLGADANVPTKRELLSDAQFARLSSRAAARTGTVYASIAEMEPMLELLLLVNEAGISRFEHDNLVFIRDFCLGLNQEFVSEAFGRTPEPPLARAARQKLATIHAN